MAKNNRDEFSEKTKLQLAKRAGWLCSDPSCRRPTIGATSDGNSEINLGTAAHICAAAPDGPRYDLKQTPAQRRSPDNGLWMCRLHGTAIDTKDSKYTVQLLLEWKAQAHRDSWRRVLYGDVPLGPVVKAASEHQLSTRLRAAAAADLDVFRNLDKWPSTAIALTLEVDGMNDSVSASALANALTTLDDLILVAPPGMGKTTTLFQIAEALLASGNASPIVVTLGDWAVDGATLLESVLKRPAFRNVSEHDLRTVAAKPGVILLLDGWNELDIAARKRLTAQVSRIQAELPDLGLLISTRKQAIDVPVNGTRIDLLPLSETQQLDIAKALRGDPGVRMVDHAWRTAGIRELVTIPLYLTALLALPEGVPFPTTKEEVLRRFVGAHENDAQRGEALAEVTHHLHQRFLEDLAATATRAAITTFTEGVARKSISQTDDTLASEGQISEKPQPSAVLEALVSHHVLMRVGDPAGYSFQHQQFLEWYASHFVERLMLSDAKDIASRDNLKANILNQSPWEEAILFACERLSRGDLRQQEACGTTILSAFDVDPLLAAEMVFRSTDAVWARIGPTLKKLVERWHTAGRVDRALRFMVSSGRIEFRDLVWPLITHQNGQTNLAALRAGKRFRPSLLGPDAANQIATLIPEVRKHVLHEIASSSGMDGLDLATAVAKDDPDSEVKVSVIEALAFRRADRHIAEVLRSADEKTFDLVLRNDLVDETTDEYAKKGIEAARKRQRKKGMSTYDRLRAIVRARGVEDRHGELTKIISKMEIEQKRDAEIHLIYEARNHYSKAIADGILKRVRAGRTLFYGADDLLASAGFSLEDNGLLKIALAKTDRNDTRAEAAASVLGPQAVARMISTIWNAKKRTRVGGIHDQAAVDRYYDLLARIGHVSGKSLISAVLARSKIASNKEMAALAELISRHPAAENDRGRPFDATALKAIRSLAEEWGTRMLASGKATRSQLASIAMLAQRAPSIDLLQLLKRLLDEELQRYRAFRETAEATNWRQGNVTEEARVVHTHQYQLAFQAIRAPETLTLMREYLHDKNFGELAAHVLAAQWTASNEPNQEGHFRGGIDFSEVEERRAARAKNPTASSAEADAIFDAVELLISNETTDAQKRHAVVLGTIAARLPHGVRDATIQKLISIASRRSRTTLLQNLVLSGEIIDIETIKNGIAEMFEAAKTESWILTEGSALRKWLRLLPFANRPSETLDVVRDLPDGQRSLGHLESMINGFGMAPGAETEAVLFQLAEWEPRLYANRAWRNAAMRRGTLSAAKKFVILAANGAFEDKDTDLWHLARQLSSLIGEHPKLRAHVYWLLSNSTEMPGLELIAKAVAESPDTEGLLLLVKFSIARKRTFLSWRSIENVVTEHRSSDSWKGAYEVVPLPAVELRRQLLAMTTDGGRTDIAARCLNEIDKIRDEYGNPESGPRHPDLTSGKPWPIMKPDTNLSELR